MAGLAAALALGPGCGGAGEPGAANGSVAPASAVRASGPGASSGRGRVVITETSMEIAGPMLFEWGEVSLSDAVRRNLKAAARTLAALDDIAVVEVRGHSDIDERRPRVLAAERARRAVELLVELGIARQRLRAIGRGADEPVVTHGDRRDRAANRRLELRIGDQPEL